MNKSLEIVWGYNESSISEVAIVQEKIRYLSHENTICKQHLMSMVS